jgi:predicted nucleic acid-binding protein
MSILVDSNVLIDVIDSSSAWHGWASARISEMANRGTVYINQIILAETAQMFQHPAGFDRFANQAGISRESVPWEACYEAGLAHAQYRKSGGGRERTLPDFFVGAHAQVRGYRVLTRDPRRYRHYFPRVGLITPDALS